MATLCMGGLAIGLAAPADSVANQAAQTALAVDNESIAITVAGKPT